MISAKEHIDIHLGGNMNVSTLTPKAIEEMINSYAAAVIKECAERANTKVVSSCGGDGNSYDYGIVDKQSILSLIDELK